MPGIEKLKDDVFILNSKQDGQVLFAYKNNEFFNFYDWDAETKKRGECRIIESSESKVSYSKNKRSFIIQSLYSRDNGIRQFDDTYIVNHIAHKDRKKGLIFKRITDSDYSIDFSWSCSIWNNTWLLRYNNKSNSLDDRYNTYFRILITKENGSYEFYKDKNSDSGLFSSLYYYLGSILYNSFYSNFNKDYFFAKPLKNDIYNLNDNQSKDGVIIKR